MIAHPPCTYLCSSGLHHNKGNPKRQKQTEIALNFVRQLMSVGVDRICIENSRGCIGTRIKPKSQTIHPYEFGHDASKTTDLWLKNLPLLSIDKSAFVEPRWICCGAAIPPSFGRYGCPYCCGDKKALPRWANQTDSGQNRLPPSATRGHERSKTYKGIAEAMAAQWGATP